MTDNPLTARYLAHAENMVRPYPAQMICLGDPSYDSRHWWWFPVDEEHDGRQFHVRCQDAAEADLG